MSEPKMKFVAFGPPALRYWLFQTTLHRARDTCNSSHDFRVISDWLVPPRTSTTPDRRALRENYTSTFDDPCMKDTAAEKVASGVEHGADHASRVNQMSCES